MRPERESAAHGSRAQVMTGVLALREGRCSRHLLMLSANLLGDGHKDCVDNLCQCLGLLEEFRELLHWLSGP
ncbi:MAG: hypothetical protein N2512_11910, partial [Armatimonadetes bacterium]|nr:hypothetical protein [Armatimonadota bacterium]